MNFRFHKDVIIPVDRVMVKGELIIPEKAKGIVVFSHGSGSSRLSKRNQEVARFLDGKNFGTLLFDLLTEEEDEYYENRFDINLLTKRLIEVTEWLEKLPAAKNLPIGYFGASTGAASALKAAAFLPQVGAVVSRGGRPDLATNALSKVGAPVLLIVGSHDREVLQLNKDAYAKLNCPKKLEIVSGATHLFEEPGTMEQVAELASAWFKRYLVPIRSTNYLVN